MAAETEQKRKRQGMKGKQEKTVPSRNTEEQTGRENTKESESHNNEDIRSRKPKSCFLSLLCTLCSKWEASVSHHRIWQITF